MFATSAIVFGILDFIWLGFIARSFNLAQLAEIGRFKNGEFDLFWPPALLVYLLMSLSVVLFVMPRLEASEPLWLVLLTGASMGLITYGVFDLTNLAILKNYPMKFALVDMAWGSFAFSIATIATHQIRSS